jgi:hypothetical protein
VIFFLSNFAAYKHILKEMKRLLLYCFLFWAAHHDSSEYNVHKRNRKSSDTELLPGASILAIHTQQDLGILHYQMEKVGLVC